MITTNVQPASQAVEIQGAPPIAAGLGDEFRATFAASFGVSAAQDAKNATATVKIGVAGGSVADSEKAGKAALNATFAVSSSDFDLAQIAPRTIVSTATADTDAPPVKTPLPIEKLPVQAVDPASAEVVFGEKGFDSRAKDLTLTAAAVEPSGSSAVLNSPQGAKQGSNPMVRSRKEDPSAVDKNVTAVPAKAIDQDSVPLGFNAATTGLVANTLPHPYTQPSSLSLETPGAGGPAHVILVSRLEPVAAAIPSAPGKSSDPAPTPNALAGLDRVQPSVPESPNVPLLQVSQENTSTADRVITAALNAAGIVAKAAARNAPRDTQSIAVSHHAIDSQTSIALSVKTASVPDVVLASIDPANGLQQQTVATPSKATAARDDDSFMTGAASNKPNASPVSEARSIDKRQPMRFSRSPAVFLLETQKVASASPEPASDLAAGSFGSSHVADAASRAGTLATATPLSVDGHEAQALDSVHEAVPLSALPSGLQGGQLAGLPSGTRPAATVAEAKGEKTKPLTDGGRENFPQTQPTVSQSPLVSPPNVSASNSLGTANAFAAVSTGSSGAGVPFIHAAVAETVAPAHAATAIAAPTHGSHPLTEADGSALSESNAAAAQIGDSHRTLLATPTALEVGVQNGTQGWLRIRAEVGGQGEVNTSLAAASSGGREMLHSQMPALNAFLHSEQIAATATVADRAASANGGLQGGTAMGSGGLGNQAGSGGSNGSLLQGGGAQSDRSQREVPLPLNGNEVVSNYDARSGMKDTSGLPSGRITVSEESGLWLNVRV